ncbi:MAG: response regulator [Gammaproteobacteria bacterium]|nr:response regulator [Gammaproteobacteria bacterium]MCP5202525.1 response regulator [Gammaproteobacteria bacterium]
MSGARVLIVDDEAYVTHVLNQFLARAGYTVKTASNGAQALALLETFDADALITDVQMPRLGGRELVGEVATRFPRADRLVLVMTSRTDRELRAWACSVENADFLEKPVSPRRVVARLAEHFAPQEAVNE